LFYNSKKNENGKWEVGNEKAGHENAYSDLSVLASAKQASAFT